LRASREQQRIETIKVDVVRLISSGMCVVSERIDYLRNAEGRVLATVPVAGIMDFRSGKIRRLARVLRQQAHGRPGATGPQP
jgi:limonene-1,2-epoxide hydrolase